MCEKTLTLLLLATAVVAAEPAGSRAAAERWTHPRGPAAGNGRSRARAPDSFGGIVWSYKARKEIVAPPLTWDGAAFVRDGSSLAALDVETGDVLARTTVKVADPLRIATYDRSVFLLGEGGRLAQLRLRGRQFVRGWSFAAGEGASAPCIVEGEIFLTTAAGLLRLRAGSREAVWTAAGEYLGDPAVYGDHVYAVKRTGGQLVLAAHLRTGGEIVASLEIGRATGRGGRVIVTRNVVGVLLPPAEGGKWAIVRRKPVENGPPDLEFDRNESLLNQPSTGESNLLGMTGKPLAWTLLSVGKRKRMPLTAGRHRPDLVADVSSPVSLNWPTVVFGMWAGNVHSMRILWHLNERPEIKTFQQGVRFSAVPARHALLLVVPEDGKSLHAIGPEEIE
ncbi:MAG: outer membrane protein assembly factor BamB family protein [Planctomycetota bacterium]|jgi:hypothetical protein